MSICAIRQAEPMYSDERNTTFLNEISYFAAKI